MVKWLRTFGIWTALRLTPCILLWGMLSWQLSLLLGGTVAHLERASTLMALLLFGGSLLPRRTPLRRLLLGATAVLLYGLSLQSAALQAFPWISLSLAAACFGAACAPVAPAPDALTPIIRAPSTSLLPRIAAMVPLGAIGLATPGLWRAPLQLLTPSDHFPILLGVIVPLLTLALAYHIGKRPEARSDSSTLLHRILASLQSHGWGIAAIILLLQRGLLPTLLEHLFTSGTVNTDPGILLLLILWTAVPLFFVGVGLEPGDHFPSLRTLLMTFLTFSLLSSWVLVDILPTSTLLTMATAGMLIAALLKGLMRLRAPSPLTFQRLITSAIPALLLLPLPPLPDIDAARLLPKEPSSSSPSSQSARVPGDVPKPDAPLRLLAQDAHSVMRISGTLVLPRYHLNGVELTTADAKARESFSAQLAGLLQPTLGSVLVVNPGTGIAADTLRLYAPTELHLLTPSRLRSSVLSLLWPLNKSVLKDPRMKLHQQALRPFAALNPASFQTVVVLPPSGALERRHLYSREGFYPLQQMLRPGGQAVVVLPLSEDLPLASTLTAFYRAFPSMQVWLAPEDQRVLLLVGRRIEQMQPPESLTSPNPYQSTQLSLKTIERQLQRAGVAESLRPFGISDPLDLVDYVLCTEQGIALLNAPAYSDWMWHRADAAPDSGLVSLAPALLPITHSFADLPASITSLTLQSRLQQALERHKAWLGLLEQLQKGDFLEAVNNVQKLTTQGDEATAQIRLLSSPYLDRARSLLAERRMDKAIEQLSMARLIDASNPDVYLLLAKAYQQKEVPDQVLQLLMKALELAPDNVDVALALADFHRQERRITDAIRVLESVQQRVPQTAILQHNIATLYLTRGDMQRAKQGFELAIRLKDSFAEAHAGLAEVYLSQGRLDAALQEAEIAVRQMPDADRLNLLGQIKFRAGDRAGARSAFVQSLLKNPDQLEARGAMGILYAEAGEFERAREAWESILAQQPNNRAAQENLARLNRDFPSIQSTQPRKEAQPAAPTDGL